MQLVTSHIESNGAHSLEMPRSDINKHCVETERYFDENAMLHCNAVGGPDFPRPEAIETWVTYLLP